ncbi:MAG: SCO family protein [Paraperlucidibaca sp.]
MGSRKRKSPRQKMRIAIVIALVISLGLVSWAWLQRPQYSGLPVLKLGGEFSLANANGQPFSLSDSNGQVRLLSFGYTHCPDVCPLTLARYRAVLEALSADAAKLQPIMVSIDPARDTPELLQKYVSYFSPSIVGLTGTSAAIAAVAKQYGVYVSVQGNEVSHSDYLYLIDRDGRVRRLYDQQAGVTAIVQEAKALMQEPREGV